LCKLAKHLLSPSTSSRTDVKYHHLKLAGDETTLISSTIRVGKTIKKSNVMSIEEGHEML
jgi:hypothetical protein